MKAVSGNWSQSLAIWCRRGLVFAMRIRKCWQMKCLLVRWLYALEHPFKSLLFWLVFHCAATVKFDEALRISIQMSVLCSHFYFVNPSQECDWNPTFDGTLSTDEVAQSGCVFVIYSWIAILHSDICACLNGLCKLQLGSHRGTHLRTICECSKTGGSNQLDEHGNAWYHLGTIAGGKFSLFVFWKILQGSSQHVHLCQGIGRKSIARRAKATSSAHHHHPPIHYWSNLERAVAWLDWQCQWTNRHFHWSKELLIRIFPTNSLGRERASYGHVRWCEFQCRYNSRGHCVKFANCGSGTPRKDDVRPPYNITIHFL